MIETTDNIICRYQDLEQYDYLTRQVRYQGKICSIIVFLFDEAVFAYINHCIHRQQRLDCEADTIFDRSGRFIHCSMHGCIFDPITGECISPVCAGEKLMAVKVARSGQDIVITDENFRVERRTLN